MKKRILLLALVIISLGILKAIWESVGWKMAPGFYGFMLNGIIGIASLILLLILTVGCLALLLVSYSKIKLIALFPLISLLIAVAISYYLPPLIMRCYDEITYIKNIKQYEEVITTTRKRTVNGWDDFQKLPYKYRHLSIDGLIDVKKTGRNFNVLFYIRREIGSADGVIYASDDKIIIGDKRYYRVTKKKPCWYIIELE